MIKIYKIDGIMGEAEKGTLKRNFGKIKKSKRILMIFKVSHIVYHNFIYVFFNVNFLLENLLFKKKKKKKNAEFVF